MKDKEAKEFLYNLVGVWYSDNPHYADMELLVGDVHYCFEYENSSRGMVSHVCKHYRYQLEKPVGNRKELIFIRTSHHINNHKSDFLNCEAVANKLSDPNKFSVSYYSLEEFLEAFNNSDLFSSIKAADCYSIVIDNKL